VNVFDARVIPTAVVIATGRQRWGDIL
jgi:hypothetical protein